MSKSPDDLYAMRHSLAHILAAALSRLWPDVKLGIGPVVEEGFYYDIDIDGYKISDEDFKKIEKEMRKIISENQKFVKSDKKIDEALKWAKDGSQTFKEELLNDLSREGTTSAKDIDPAQLGLSSDNQSVETVSFYTNGDFTDLCRGPHVESTGRVGAFKLLRVAGAYWRGDENKAQMQRIYGVAFETDKELSKHLDMLEEAKKRDHRKLGKELDLYATSDLVGSGLPLFTPRGTVLRELLGSYSQQLRQSRGFERVWTPHITKTDLYKKSGHWDKFGDELFLVKSQETSDELAMKPMNCPHHTQIYASKPRSHKDLPVRYMENTTDYRDEKSGELHGLSRVRSLTQDDSHVFCTEDQIESSVSSLIEAAQQMYRTLGMDLKLYLSFRDEKDSYLGSQEQWGRAQNALEEIAKKNTLEYKIDEGEAAFYGPKIDFVAVDVMGRQWQLATVQLDFVQPDRFELEYTARDGSKKTPVMIHCALLGSMERFLSVYIEHTAGHFPFWLAPEQIRVLTINDSVTAYVTKIIESLENIALSKPLRFNELRFTVDTRNESLGKKIKEARNLRIPVMLIVGPRDMENGTVSAKTAGNEENVPLDKLVEWINEQNLKSFQE